MRILCLILSICLAVVPQSGEAAGEKYQCESSGTLNYSLEIPDYDLTQMENGETRVSMDNSGYGELIGYPRLPGPVYTFALPPGTRAGDVEISGARIPLEGQYLIEASFPPLAEGSFTELNSRLMELYRENKTRVYSGQEPVSLDAGKVIAFEQRREYSLLTVKLNPFSYDPVTGELSVASRMDVSIEYVPVNPDNAALVREFIEAGTIQQRPSEIVVSAGTKTATGSRDDYSYYRGTEDNYRFLYRVAQKHRVRCYGNHHRRDRGFNRRGGYLPEDSQLAASERCNQPISVYNRFA